MNKTVRNWTGLWKTLYEKIEKEINNNAYLKNLQAQIPKEIPKWILTEAITNYYYNLQTKETLPLYLMFELYPIENIALSQKEWIENQEFINDFYTAKS